MVQNEVRYHKPILEVIRKFKNLKTGVLISKVTALNKLKVNFKPYKSEFKINFNYNIFGKERTKLDIGQEYKKVEIQFSNSSYILERVFLTNHAPPEFTGKIHRIHTKGFSEKTKYYYQLATPLEKELIFHFQIEETLLKTDLGNISRNALTAIINCESLKVYCIKDEKNDFFLIIESPVKQTFNEFSEKANALKIALGYLLGYYAGNQGYFFAYTSKENKQPKYFRVVQMRDSIKSSYNPIYANAYAYLYSDKKLAEKYSNKLRPVSLTEFSNLCEKIHSLPDFASVLVLILESSVASLLFMPGGYAIALETLSDIIIGKTKLKLAPIKDKSVSRKVRKEMIEVLNKNKSTILPIDLETLYKRIDQLNQTTNKARLKAPFDLLKIILNEEDLKILETRNDFLHGRVPDLKNSGITRSSERMNKDLYYCSVRFYTLLNMLILKWIGYDSRVINYPKVNESFTEIYLDEEPFRIF